MQMQELQIKQQEVQMKGQAEMARLQLEQQRFQLEAQKFVVDTTAKTDKQELEEQKVAGQLELDALRVGAQINESKSKEQARQEEAGVRLGAEISKAKMEQAIKLAQLEKQTNQPTKKGSDKK
jgi:hypothetical protein